MQEKFCFGGISVSVFVRFAFQRLGSAPLGSVRGKDQADYMYVSEDTARPCIEIVPYTVAQSLKLAGTT